MMKKMLILTSKSEKTVSWKERSAYVQEFCDDLNRELAARKVPVEAVFSIHDELLFEIFDKQVEIYDTKNDMALKDYAFVHFKNWVYNLEPASVTARFLKRHGIPFANSEVTNAMCLGKLSQMVELATAGLPVPDTLYGSKKAILDYLGSPRNTRFKLPLVIKDSDGSKGDHNFLAKSLERIAEIYDTHAEKYFIVQNYIPNTGDYRILFIGLDNLPLIFRRTAVKGSHLNNTSKGGSAAFIDPATLPEGMLELAKQAAKALKREITCVDILIDETSGQQYILEANSTPAIATGFGVKEKTDVFAEYLARLLKN